ncbi:hypothetical protein N7488_004497 [Penicillium malachiteum]|nr:hypothetical protein N7488_004497 [Penicillium malachiteum]
MASMSFGQNNGFQVGTSNGPISATFLAPDRPETPPSPLSTVPFRQDPDFVSRDTLLQRIREKSTVPGSAIALVGLGGVGKIALKLVAHDNIIMVEPMRKSEASELLQKKLGLQRETSEVRDLAQELDFMPLAISRAAGYIKHRAPRSSISQYLAKLKKSDRDAIRLLDTEKSSSSDDSEQQRLILATWAISFEHIRQSNASAANLLSLMSFFDRQGVSERLLRGAPKSIAIHSSEDEDEDSMSETDADQDFEDDITVLRDTRSFLSRKTACSLHCIDLSNLQYKDGRKRTAKLRYSKKGFLKTYPKRFLGPPVGMKIGGYIRHCILT